MNNNNIIKVFENLEFGSIRVSFNENNEPIFCLKDLCLCLDLKQPSKVKERLNNKGVLTIPTLTNGGVQQLLYVNESNLYRLIFQSRKPDAEKFQDWVTDVVLPSIRQNGGYIVNQENLSETELLAKALLVAQNVINNKDKQIKELTSTNKILIEENEIMKPKAKYHDMILNNDELLTTTQIAKDYGYSAIGFNKLLNNFKIQYKQGNNWYLFSNYQKEGYTSSKSYTYGVDENGIIKSNTYTCWTQKGRLFLYNFLKENGILPLIEKFENEKF